MNHCSPIQDECAVEACQEIAADVEHHVGWLREQYGAKAAAEWLSAFGDELQRQSDALYAGSGKA